MLSLKFRFLLLIAMISWFTMKLVISVVPVLFHATLIIDKSYSADLDQEHGSEEEAKAFLKITDDSVAELPHHFTFIPVSGVHEMRNWCTDHYKRLIEPCYLSVPTPPPNVDFFA